MNKLEYIRNSIKDLDEHILVSKKKLPDGTYVSFIEYCEKYVPSLLNSKFEFENNEFIKTMKDLIDYQKYIYNKYENKEKIKKEDKKIFNDLDNISNNDDLSSDSPYIESIDSSELKEENKNKLNLATKLKKYYENYLDYVVFFMKKNITLEEYIKSTYPKMDNDCNYFYNNISVPYEEEIREKASLAISSYKYAHNLLKDLNKNGLKIVDKAYTIGYIASVPKNVDKSDIYYTLAITNVKKSFELLSNKNDKEEFFKNITNKRIENKELYHDIVEYYQYSINPDMEHLMNELEETELLPNYTNEFKNNMMKIHNEYDELKDKNVDELSNILKDLNDNLDYIESKYNETKIDEYKEYLDVENEFKYKVKSDYIFHKKLNKSKKAYKIINDYLNSNNKVNIALMYEQLKKISEFVDDIWIKNHQSEIITNEDQIFRENLKGKLESIKELYEDAISVEYN